MILLARKGVCFDSYNIGLLTTGSAFSSGPLSQSFTTDLGLPGIELLGSEKESGHTYNGSQTRRAARAMRLSDENLRGRTVIAADGQAIGEIAALFLDSDTWRVESLQVKLRNEVADQLGAARNIFHAATLEMPIRMVQSVGDAVVLSVAANDLRQVLPGVGEASATP